MSRYQNITKHIMLTTKCAFIVSIKYVLLMSFVYIFQHQLFQNGLASQFCFVLIGTYVLNEY